MGQRRTLAGLRVLITGASQGIGRALALAAAQRGMQVLATARSKPLLDSLAEEVAPLAVPFYTQVADISDPNDRQAMVEAATHHFQGLDILINNAGVGATGQFMESTPETLRQIMEVNFFGTTETIRVFLPLLQEGTTPAIVNISSVLGKRAFPGRALYSASKFAIQGFSEALRAELYKDDIDVLVVNPGLTQTNFSQNLLERKARMSLDHMRGMTSEQVANATLNALARGHNEITLTLSGKALVLAARFMPRVVDFFAKRKVRKLYQEEIAKRRQQREGQPHDHEPSEATHKPNPVG